MVLICAGQSARLNTLVKNVMSLLLSVTKHYFVLKICIHYISPQKMVSCVCICHFTLERCFWLCGITSICNKQLVLLYKRIIYKTWPQKIIKHNKTRNTTKLIKRYEPLMFLCSNQFKIHKHEVTKITCYFFFYFHHSYFQFYSHTFLFKFQMKNQIKTYEPLSFHMMKHSHENMILPCKTKKNLTKFYTLRFSSIFCILNKKK